ncbi:MAG TPA: hypothetical protein VII60_09040 [Acidimicrobiales bacterium]
MSIMWAPGLGRYLLLHPSALVPLARAGWRLRRAQWGLHAPFLPLPDPTYWHFRMVTVNGTSGAMLTPRSMVEAAKWALRQPQGQSS